MKAFLCIFALAVSAQAGLLPHHPGYPHHADVHLAADEPVVLDAHHLEPHHLGHLEHHDHHLNHHVDHHLDQHHDHHHVDVAAKVVHHNDIHVQEPVHHLTKVVHHQPHHFLHYTNHVVDHHVNEAVHHTHSHAPLVHSHHHLDVPHAHAHGHHAFAHGHSALSHHGDYHTFPVHHTHGAIVHKDFGHVHHHGLAKKFKVVQKFYD